MTTRERKNLGRKIRYLRELRQLTQAQLAKLIEGDAPTLSLVENGKANPSVEYLERIAHALHVPLVGLFESE